MSDAVVAVVAHPDDESLIAGGTLALAAQAGLPTGVACLTRGENGPVSDARLVAGGELGDVREAELHAAATALGVDWSVCLRYTDGELPWVDHAAAARELAEVFDRHPPGAVLTFGDDGLYGHPDHAAARDLAVQALDRVGRQAHIYEAAWPWGLFEELVAAAAARGLPTDLWDIDPDAFGCDVEPTVTVDVRPVLERKLAGLRAHRTQVGPDHLLADLPMDLAERFLGFEPWHGPRDGVLAELLARG